MENPIKMGWFGGKTHYFRKPPHHSFLKLQVWLIEELNFCWRKGGTRESDIWAEVLTVDAGLVSFKLFLPNIIVTRLNYTHIHVYQQ